MAFIFDQKYVIGKTSAHFCAFSAATGRLWARLRRAGGAGAGREGDGEGKGDDGQSLPGRGGWVSSRVHDPGESHRRPQAPGFRAGRAPSTASRRGTARVVGLTPVRAGEEVPESVACGDWKILPPGGKGGWRVKGKEASGEPSVARLTVSFLQEGFRAMLDK